MARDEAYRRAEKKTEKARRSGAKKLDLSHIRLTELPESLGQLTQLQKLYLSDNRLTTLPESLGQLTHLQELHLSDNQLTSLPKWVGQLTQLHTLDISFNRLTALPESLGQLTQLHVLYLYRNQLTLLPESLGELTQLQMLHLFSNRLTMLPESLGQLTQLQALYLYNNQLTSLPESVGQLTQLQTLHVYNNQLTSLPESLGQLTQLQTLILFGNQLTELPESFGQFAQLQTLYLSGNQLTSLPESLGELTQLQELHLFGNQLTSLPESLGELTQLQRLDLSNNLLTSLPESLGDITELVDLTLDHNPLNAELAAAYKEGLDSVMRYLLAKAKAQVVLREAKLILIGEGEVGKSCLLGALRGDPWEPDKSTTHGIEIKPVKMTDPANGTEITLNGWDFGGQRVYRPTHQLFFSAPAVYLVVWKPREGPQQGFVKDWIKLVKHREPDAKIIVVATHGGPKERQPDIDRQEIWDAFGKETVIDFFSVESKPDDQTGERVGIAELRDAITRVSAWLPEMGRTFPRQWQEVRKKLCQSKEAYLPLDSVFAIGKEYELEEEDTRLLLNICRRVGDLIHYEHDPALRDIVILKPDWLATAMSFVLDDKKTREGHGLVSFARLGQLWDDPERPEENRYPAKLHPVFRRLMERFDLSYRVAGSPLGGEADETSLIAQLVPDVRPEADIMREWPQQPQAGDEQQVQICRIVDAKGQSASAEGLFYQLIVRLHKFSLGREDFNKSVHWQRGLILDDDYNGRALLEYIDNDVKITVRAPYPGNLLAVLTREVKWLVEKFWEGLKCQVVVPCIEPCGKNLPGTGLFEVQKLVAFKKQGLTLFPCPVSGCDKAHEIDCLLQNAPASRRPSIESLIEEGFGDMRIQFEEIRQTNIALDRNLCRFMSRVEDAFHGLMQTMTDEAKEGPRLFSLEPVELSKFNPKGWAKKKFRVTLWCEHTRLPLPLLDKDAKSGVYEIDVTREWFAKAAPFLKLLTGTLSLVLPVAAAATKLALDEDTYRSLENRLDFGKECAEAMSTAVGKGADWFAEKEGLGAERIGVRYAEGGDLRQFQVWLKEKDARFGGLVRVQNKRQEFLWVHPQFEKEY